MFQITNKTTRLQIQNEGNKNQKEEQFKKSYSRNFMRFHKKNATSTFSVSTPKKSSMLPKLEVLNYSKPKAIPKLIMQRQKQKQDRYNKISLKFSETTSNSYQQKFFRSQKRTSNTVTTINVAQKKSLSQLDLSISLKASINQLNYTKSNSLFQQQYFVTSRKGKRSYNQDRSMCISKLSKIKQNKTKLIGFRNQYDYFAVFDGHGGSTCSQFLKENMHNLITCTKQVMTDPITALKQAFQKAQQKFIRLCQQKIQLETSGSCAVVCLIMKSGIYVANLGDSRAILFNQQQFLEMTKDHKPFDKQQKMRIIRCGGKIYKEHEKGIKHMKVFRQTRIMPGNLNVSRAIGDIQVKLKKYGGLPGMISSIPDVTFHQKNNFDFMLLASDGLFEAFTSIEIKDYYVKICQQMKQQDKLKILQVFTQNLANQAELRSSDNITIVTVLL